MTMHFDRRRFLVHTAGAGAALAGLHSFRWLRADAVSAKDAAAKADEVLKQMTLDEKIGQMTQVDSNALKDKSHIAKFFLGSVLSGGGSDPKDNSAQSWAALNDECQAEAAKTRLKIPLLYGIDAVHGHNNIDGAVIIPHNIALGATRSPELVEQAARVTAEEMHGTGANWAFAPCVAVARNPRWGRTYESFGELPELAEKLGPAAVRGLQGKNLGDAGSVVACAKHFIGDGGTTNGKDQGNTECDEATLRKIHLPGYLTAMKAGVGTIMVSYNSWNGQKLHGQKYLLTDVLKNELGFEGFLISDWAAIDQLGPKFKDDIEKSINAGLDMIMVPNGPGQGNNYVQFIDFLKQLVEEGKVPQSRIDDAVRRILRVKFLNNAAESGKSNAEAAAKIGSKEHRDVARKCVQQSLVLLKNDGNALPLKKDTKHICVLGRAASDLGVQCGGWTIDWQGKPGQVTKGGTTILDAIKNSVSKDTTVSYNADPIVANNVDAIVVVVGEQPYAEMKGDSKDLKLPAEAAPLLKAAKEAVEEQLKLRSEHIPIITVLLSGRPLLLDSTLDNSDAFVAAWLPGTEGQGVADVLFGDVKPSGKLPRTWPKSADQIGLCQGDPGADKAAFPYGFGLTY
jgi:beta-glucosidase